MQGSAILSVSAVGTAIDYSFVAPEGSGALHELIIKL